MLRPRQCTVASSKLRNSLCLSMFCASISSTSGIKCALAAYSQTGDTLIISLFYVGYSSRIIVNSTGSAEAVYFLLTILRQYVGSFGEGKQTQQKQRGRNRQQVSSCSKQLSQYDHYGTPAGSACVWGNLLYIQWELMSSSWTGRWLIPGAVM